MCEPGRYPSLEQVVAMVQEEPAERWPGDFCPEGEHKYGPWEYSANTRGAFDGKPYDSRVCSKCRFMDLRAPQTPKPLTARQREIVRAYFASGSRTCRAAKALGVNVSRVRQVKAKPAARVYLAELEAETTRALVQARAAQLLAPML